MNSKTSKYSTWLMQIAISAIASSSFLLPQATFAQASGLNNSQPVQDFQTNDNPDPFTGRGSGTGLFDLIHRSRLGGGRSIDEFTTEQRQNLNDAATEFRDKQRQLLQKQAEPSSGTIAPTEITAPVP
jgi:hypothetical protein